jgi:alpha-tubulin suppressor-like RCC1 family protein
VDTTEVFTDITAGGSHTCGLSAAGKALCWGSDNDGQLGNGSGAGESQEPAAVDTTMLFVALSAGGSHGCGLTVDGAVWCWGRNEEGQLGGGSSGGPEQSPVAVSTSEFFVRIATGRNHTCGLNAKGEAFCWGSDQQDQLGDGGDSEDSPSPVPVDMAPLGDGSGFVQLVSGDDHVCGLTAVGRAYCWGQNQDGQLGAAGAGLTEASPVRVDSSGMTGVETFVRISAGKRHTCGSTAEGLLYCWGSDERGRLGNGDGQGDSPVPVGVVWMGP